jgi:signal transduction histidine kinase
VTRPGRQRAFRRRLAMLYTCLFLCMGVVLVVITDLPLLRFGRVSPASGDGPRAAGHARTIDNLPQVLHYSGIALVALAMASVVLGWLVADRALRPLRAITTAARAISASSLGERLRLDYSYQEFRELGEALDDLFGRLEAAFESQRHFVANASHELRTPLAAERAVLQVALADPHADAQSLRAACQQLLALGKEQEQLIDALLTLASGQGGLREREPFDLAEVTGKVVAARQEEAALRDVRMEADLGPAVTTGDARLAERLVANLLDNAIAHNVPGGHVRVTTMAAGTACLSVVNTGPVVPPDEVGRLFQPFQQLDGERTRHRGGYGLGLAIVASIAAAHAASLSARARPEGGLAVEVGFASVPASTAGPRD